MASHDPQPTPQNSTEPSNAPPSTRPEPLEQPSRPASPRSQPSPARLAANRANAQKSTGPRTEAGKDVSRLNALRHGLRASSATILSRASDEERALYEQLAAQLAAEFQPQTSEEHLLLERLALAYLRLARASRIETNSVARLFERAAGTPTYVPRAHAAVVQYDIVAERSVLRLLRALRAARRERLARPAPVVGPPFEQTNPNAPLPPRPDAIFGPATTTSDRIDLALDAFATNVAALHGLAPQWDKLHPIERTTWALDWDQCSNLYLNLLHRHYRSRAMTREQQARYVAILRQLRDAIPLLRRFGLYPPRDSRT